MPGSSAAGLLRLLAERTGTDAVDWHLVFRARYGMQVVFRTIAEQRGAGEVATQLLTCATAVDPIIAGGLTPAYGEVAADSLALDPGELAVGEDTRAVVLQHTFGIIDGARSAALRAVADRTGTLLVEDSAHCVGRLARHSDGSPLADVSIHSFGAEKVLPTRFGGAAWVRPGLPDAAFRDALAAALDDLPRLDRAVDLRSRLYRNQIRVLNRLPQSVSGRARDQLTRRGLFEPLISAAETRGELPHEPMAPAPWMVAGVIRQMARLTTIERQRAAAVAIYVRALSDVVQVPGSISVDAPLVRFPFFVRTTELAERIISEVTAAGIFAGRWYRPALFPGPEDPSAYGFDIDRTTPQTQGLISRIVNLPTGIPASEALRAASLVRELIGTEVSAAGSSRT